MSGAGEEAVSVSATDIIGARAAQWVQRRHFWSWSDADQRELDAWLEEAMGHRIAYWRMNAAFERTERLVILRSSAEETASNLRRKWFRRAWMTAIAVVAVVLAGAASFELLGGAQERVYATALGEHETITLADGSQMELNTDTLVRVSANAHRRIVSLVKGEAYFTVRHDAMRPFIVVAGERRLTDIGTKFLVRRDADQLAVAVMEGRVKLDALNAQAQSPATILGTGDAAIATADKLSVTKKPARELIGELGWRRGLLVFQHTTLGEAANEFNRYNAEKLVVVDTKTATLQINGTFRENDVEAFTGAVQDVFGLQVRNMGGEIVISR
jgi:transmembrane sensor